MGMPGASGGGGGDSGPTSTTQTMVTEPWSAQQPYLKDGFAAAKDLFLDSHPTVFPNSMVLPFSPETQTAMQLTTQRALNGSPIQANANSQLNSTINGDYLNNPTVNGDYLYGGDGFNAAYKAASDKVLPQVDSAFESSGRFNSGLAKVAQTDALANAFAGQYGQERQLQEQNFANSRQNQLQATSLAPNFAAQDYNDLTALNQVGQSYQDQLQNQLNEQIYRYGYDQNIPRDDLMQYMQLIQGNYGQSSTGTTTSNSGGSGGGEESGSNPIMSGLGGATAGASVGGPWGAVIGGGLGLVSSFI